MASWDDVVEPPVQQDWGALTEPTPEEVAKRPTAMDILKQAAIGFWPDTAQGIGYLLEKGGVDYGRRMREAGAETERQIMESMTPGGRRAAETPMFEGEGLEDLALTDKWGQSLTMGAARSLPQMAQMVLPGAAIAKGVSAIPGMARLAGAPGALGAAARYAPGALGFGAAEGLQAGALNAAQTQGGTEARDLKDLVAHSPRFRALLAEMDPEAARRSIAAEEASQVFRRTALWTGGVGALTGGGALGALVRPGTGTGVRAAAKAIGKGAATEAIQETPQSGGERYIQNVAEREFADERVDPWKQVVSEALTGGAIGGVTGGAVGGGAHAFSGRTVEGKVTGREITRDLGPAREALGAMAEAQKTERAVDTARRTTKNLKAKAAAMAIPPTEGAADVEQVELPETGQARARAPAAAAPEASAVPGTEAAQGEPVDEAAHEAATSPTNDLPEPTEGQKEAGNYKKGHLKVAGLDVSIENPAGSKRRPEWPTLESHYGYVKDVPARAPDKDHVDVFVKPGTTEDFAGDVYVVDQQKEDGSFDEPKTMVGFASEQEAREAYQRNYTPDWKGARDVTAMPIVAFRERLQDPKAFLQPQRPEKWKGDVSAEKVRSDQKQAGEGRAEGQPGVQPGADERGANLQRPAASRPKAGDREEQVAGAPTAYTRKAKAVRVARQLTAAGEKHKVVDHPTEKGKFAVVPVEEQTLVIPERDREILRTMAAESGWIEQGGRAVGAMTPFDERLGDKTRAEMTAAGMGRTKWIGKLEWARGFGYSVPEMKAIVEKAIAGKPLGSKQRLAVQAMLDDLREGEALNAQEAAQAEANAEEAVPYIDGEKWRTITEEQKDAELDALFGPGKDSAPAAEGAQPRAPVDEAEARPALPADEREPGQDDEGVAASTAEAEPVEEAPTGAAEAATKYGFDPAAIGWERGRGLAKDRWMASAEGQQSNPRDTADEAVKELRQFVDLSKRGREDSERVATAQRAIAEKLRRGDNPSFDEWKAGFPQLKQGHTYLRQPDISGFLIEHFGFKRNAIREGLGTAAGTVTSDMGAKYPIVYFNRLADVLGQRPSLELTPQTPAEAAAEAAKEAAIAAKEAAESVKAMADEMRAGFTLTGSDRARDVGAARGQADLLEAEASSKRYDYNEYLTDEQEKAANRLAVDALNGQITEQESIDGIAKLIANGLSEGAARAQLNRLDGATEGTIRKALEKAVKPTEPEKKSKKPAAPKRSAYMDEIREFYTPGNIIFVDYWRQHDKVLEFRDRTEAQDWAVKVQRVEKRGDEWVGVDEPRWHSTAPGRDKIVEKAVAPQRTRENVVAEIDALTEKADERRRNAKDESIKAMRPTASDWMTPEESERYQQLQAELAPLEKADRGAAAERVREKRATRVAIAEGEGKITDVGENLWANRRNFTRGAIEWDTVKDLNDALKVKEVVKAKVWPKPNYEQLVADGMQPFFARMLKQVYDGIATVPAGKTDADLERYINVVGRVREAVFDWAKDNNTNQEFLKSVADRARSMMGRRIALSSIAGRDSFENAILDRVWPVADTARQRFPRDSEALKEIRAIGANRALRALQITMDDAVEAMKDLDKGWPTPQEQWQRQGYEIVKGEDIKPRYVEGKRTDGNAYVHIGLVMEGRRRDLFEQTIHGAESKNDETVQQVVNSELDRLTGKYLLLDKRGRVVNATDTEEQAKDAARELVKHETKGGEIRGMNIEAAERSGPLRRAPKRVIDGVIADAERASNLFEGDTIGTEAASLLDAPSPASLGADAEADERSAYRGAVNLKFLGNLHDAGTFSVEAFGRLDIPRKRLVLSSVIAGAENAEVRRRIIQLVPVDVMNVLSGKELSPERLLDDMPMLGDLLAVDANPSVATPDPDVLSFVRAIAHHGAERSFLDLPFGTFERDAALQATESDDSQFRSPGRDISSEELMTTFNFRGVNFGREGWINQNERQAYLNHAFDGLHDLAELLEIPPKALSLNGMLGIAFGAQGRGGRAAAHFMPGVNEINLTKTMGAGTLAHEWGHALDHYFATQGGLAKSAEPYLSHHATGAKAFGELRPEIAAAFKAVVETMEKRPMTEAETKAREEMAKNSALKSLESWLQHFRKDIERTKTSDEALKLFDEAAERLRKGDLGEGYVKVRGQSLPAVVGAIKLIVRDHTKSPSVDMASNYNGLTSNAQHVAYKLAQKEATAEHIPQTTSTAYAGESSRKDREKKGKPYWRTRWEMFARAFETYIASRLDDLARANTFLSDAALRAEARDREGGYAMPYPRGEDKTRINAAIDKLVQAIETKDTDQGVAMFSRQADAIGEYVLERGTDKRGQPAFANQHIIIANGTPGPVSRGEGVKSHAWSVYDRTKPGEKGARFLKIGSLYADLTAEGKFDKLRSIAIYSRHRQKGKGYGEGIVASMLATNGRGYRMGIENIVHHVEPKDADALPFWRKMGVRLLNYATDPNVEINGDLSLEDYLLARGERSRFARDAERQGPRGATQDQRAQPAARPAGEEGNAGALQPVAGRDGRQGILGREPGAVQGIDPSAIRQAVEPIIRAWGNAPEVVIIDSMDDAPEVVRAQDEGQRSQGATGAPEAFIYRNKVYLVAEGLASPAAAARALLHESVGHFGLRQTIGERLEPVLDDVAKSMPGRVKAKAEEYGLDFADVDQRRHAAEEVLAEIAQTMPRAGVVRRAIAAIRQFLRELGIDLELSNNDIISLFILPARGFVERGRVDATGEGAIAFARRIFRDGYRTARDFIVPETPEYEGNMTGDLASVPEAAARRGAIDALPVRLPVGIARGEHTGFGVMHMKDNAAREGRRSPPAETGDLAENFARHVVAVLRSSQQMFSDNPGRAIFRSPAMREAVVTRRMPGPAGEHYSVVTVVPSERPVWGTPVWVGRLTFPTVGLQQSVAPGAVVGQESAATNLDRAGVQTEKFDFTPKTVPVQYKGRKGGDDDTRFSRAAWIDQQPADTQEALRKAGVYYVPPSLKDRITAWKDEWAKRVRQGLVDQFDPIKEYDYKAYMLARMTRSADAALEAVMHYGTIKLDSDGAIDVDYERGGFLGILKNLHGEHDRFLGWVIGNRAERLLAEGREHNFTPQDIERLKALNQGKMHDGSARPQLYAQTRMELDRYNKSVLDIAEKAGLIDGASRSAWEKDFYIPFYRMLEEEGVKGPALTKGLVNQYAFKVLKGGEQILGDPLENVLKNWSHLIDASLKNNAARASLVAAERVGAAVEADETTAKQIAKATGNKRGAVSFVDGGAPRWFVIEDPFLLDALKSIGFTGFQGPAMKAMQNFKRWLTIGVTVSPTFRIRNVIRDSLHMIGVAPASYNVLGNVLTGWKGTERGTQEYGQIMAGGGIMRFGVILEGDRARHVKQLITSGVDKDSILTTPEKTRAMLRQAWQWWQDFGDRGENINRVALYKKMRAEGKTHLEASFQARDTMDFSMGGTWAAIRFLSQTVPFMNARLQGLYKMKRGAQEDPRRFGIVVGGAALASLALLMAYQDDDDWKAREDWDRETFWWFKIGDTAFRIPKPFEIGAIATLVERGFEAMATDELTGKEFADRVFSIVTEQLSMNPVPQLAKPMIEVWANRDFFTDRPIETMGMERLSRPLRAHPGTSATAQLAGKQGLISPVQIDHLVRGYFGWLGAHVIATADLALRPAMGLQEKPGWRVDEVLVLGDFAREMPAYQSKYVTKLYDQISEVQEAMADLRHLQKIGALEEAKAHFEKEHDKIRLYKLYSHAQRQLQNVNSQIRLVQQRAGDAAEKRERLNALYEIRNRIAKLTEERARATAQ